jgi:quercetin dioxygenase-like cupin family protein
MQLIKREQLPWSQNARELVGAEHGLDITLIFVDAEPGPAVAAHRHPYDEVFIVLEGEATFTVSGVERQAHAGDVLVAKANEPHSFVNSGTGRLRQIDIHLSPTFSTEWLAEPGTARKP